MRASLDDQRYSRAPKMTPMSSPTAPAVTPRTYHLPILRPGSSVTNPNTETHTLSADQLLGRSSEITSDRKGSTPDAIANASFAIAADRSFIETSSGLAAKLLKTYYERMGVEGGRTRVSYEITALPVHGEQKYRISQRQANHPSQGATNGSHRSSSILPSISDIISTVIASGARNSHPSGGPRQVLRRPRSISEPRDSSSYEQAMSTALGGSFINPFTSGSRRSLDHQKRESFEDSHEISPHPSESRHDEFPFGPNVVFAEPAPTSPELTARPTPELKEVQSYESGLTARAEPGQKHAAPEPHKLQVLNDASVATTPYSTLVFDVLQTYRGIPLPHRLSESSNEPTVKLRSGDTAQPSDDPRFVIWGDIYPQRNEESAPSLSSHTDLSSTSHGIPVSRRKSSQVRSVDIPGQLRKQPERLIVAATIERWIAQLTSEGESPELVYFFLTYRVYISGEDLCHLLICRFHWALETPTSEQDGIARKTIRVRTFKMIRSWLVMWFKVDFATNPTLCQVLVNWTNTLRKDPLLRQKSYSDALDIVRRIKKTIWQCKQANDRRKLLEKQEILPGENRKHLTPGSDNVISNDIIFDDMTRIQPAKLLAEPSTSPALNPALEAALIGSGSLEFSSAATLALSSIPSAGSTLPVSGVLQQPLHMAILANSKGPRAYQSLSPHSALSSQNSTFSRALVNTMGKLGRWKRVLNARSAPVPSQFDCSGVSSFDIERFEDESHRIDRFSRSTRPSSIATQHHEPGQTSKSSLGANENSGETQMNGDEKTPQPSLILHDPVRPVENAKNQPMDDPSPTGVDETPIIRPDVTNLEPTSVSSPDLTQSLGPASDQMTRDTFVSRNEARSSVASSEGSHNSFFGSSEEDYGQPIAGDLGWFQTRSSFVEIDEYQSSDEGLSNANNHLRKPMKRLPHQRDLASVYTVESLAPTVQSHNMYTDGGSDHTDDDTELHGPEKQPIQAWQLDYIDSEEDEPRDAEAALRRLEGHIDCDRQRKKENKVDGWLRQVEARRALARRGQRDVGDHEDHLDIQGEEESEGLTGRDPGSVSDEVSHLDTIDPHEVIEEHLQPLSPLSEQPTPKMQFDNTMTRAIPRPEQTRQQHAAGVSHQPSFVKISGSRGGPFSLSSAYNHQSFILTARSLKIAQQLTRIESDLWRSVQIEDLIMSSPAVDYESIESMPLILDWAEFMQNRDKYSSKFGRPSSDLLAIQARFKLTAMFTASEILMTAPPLRPMLVEKFIKIAMKCYRLNNFSSMIAIIFGLNLPSVRRVLDKMPRAIRKQEARMFDGLQSFSSSEGNYRSVRKAIANLVTSSNGGETTAPGPLNPTTTMADASCACIPFIGIYLSQLVSYDRLPDYVDPTAPTESVGVEDGSGTLSQPRHPEVFANLAPLPFSMTLEPLINVHKQRMISKVVIDFMNSRQLTSKYDFEPERKLYQQCLRLQALDMVTLEQLSQGG